MRTIKVYPPYKPLVQQKYCCLPCSIQWILLRRNLKWIDQEDIAVMCDLAIPKKLKHLFKKEIKITKKQSEYGTKVYTKKDRHIQKLFKKYKIPLKVERFLISDVKNPTEFIKKNLEEGNDVMLDFHFRGLGKRGRRWIGHVVLVNEIKLKRDSVVVLGDPSANAPKFWEIKLSKLVKAMDKKYDGHERGFWIIGAIK